MVPSKTNSWIILISLLFGFSMAILDITIVSTSMATIREQLHTDLPTVSWVLGAYNLVFAILLIVIGRLADQFGRKRIYLTGMIVFTCASLFCALAPSISWLIAFRVMQAIGAAALEPVCLAIVSAVYTTNKRSTAIAILGAFGGLATAIGPILGGIIVQFLGWRWIFGVNLPLCLIGVFMVSRFVPETNGNTKHSFNILSLISLSVGLLCLLLVINQGQSWGWTALSLLSLYIGTIVALTIFLYCDKNAQNQLIDRSLLKISSFTKSNIVMLIFSIVFQASTVLLPLFFLLARGQNQLEAALAMLPVPITAFCVSAATSRLRNLSALYKVRIGFVLLILGLELFGQLSFDSMYFDFLWRGIIVGGGISLCFTGLPLLALSKIPEQKLGTASGIFSTSQILGFALGVAILVNFLNALIGQTQAHTDTVQMFYTFTTTWKIAAIIAAIGGVIIYWPISTQKIITAKPDLSNQIATNIVSNIDHPIIALLNLNIEESLLPLYSEEIKIVQIIQQLGSMSILLPDLIQLSKISKLFDTTISLLVQYRIQGLCIRLKKNHQIISIDLLLALFARLGIPILIVNSNLTSNFKSKNEITKFVAACRAYKMLDAALSVSLKKDMLNWQLQTEQILKRRTHKRKFMAGIGQSRVVHFREKM